MSCLRFLVPPSLIMLALAPAAVASSPASSPYSAGLGLGTGLCSKSDGPSSSALADACRKARESHAGYIDRGSVSGSYPALTLQGDFRPRAKITVWASGASKDRVTVNWNVVCTTDSGTVPMTQGAFDLRRRQVRAVRLPAGLTSNDSCTIVASLSANKGFKAQIIGRPL